jgi:hypothetical protein
MRIVVTLYMVLAGPAFAQSGQQGPRPEWPCVPGRAVDPAYIETSESSGGQLFLFQKGEVAQSGPVMSAGFTHPATVFRAVGHLSGGRDFEFPVDSTVESLLVMASLQCRSAIHVTRPNGAEMTAANSALNTDLAAGKILRVDAPESGPWKLHLEGSGLFVISVMAKSKTRLASVQFAESPRVGAAVAIEAHFSGEIANAAVGIIAADGNSIAAPQALDETGQAEVTPRAQRFRVVVTGTDASGWPVQRVYPNLFRAAE